ncbi:unnamed protein product [Prunus brigantina]
MSKQNAYIHGGGGTDFFYSIYWADSMIKEKAHKPRLNDLMYLPTCGAYGLSSVADI